MRARNTDMKAPPAPRADATAAIAQDDPLDLATSTIRPTVHPVLAGLKEARRMLAEVQAPIVEILREKLKGLHEAGSLGSSAENAEAVAMVNRLAKDCGMNLTYKGEPVALVFSDDARYKAGTFVLRTFGPNRKPVYAKTSFPQIELAANPATHNPENPTRQT